MKKILIVNSNYYKKISKNLLIGAKKELSKDKNIKISLIEVPGVFEIPNILSKYLKSFNGFIVLGCVIKGKTPHFNLICKSSFDGIMNLSIVSKKPIGNGIITALNMNQAINRSSLNISKKNKGREAVNAVTSILKNEPKKI